MFATSHSPKYVSGLIGTIYDCVLDPTRWHATLDEIRQALGFCYAILGVYPLPAGEITLGVSAGIDEVRLHELMAFGEDIVELWGGVARIAQFPLEEPIVQSDVVSSHALANSRYYVDWARPQGVADAVAIGLERSSRMVSTLSFGRHDMAGPLGATEIDMLRLLSPHLRRAIAISHLLDLKSVTAANATAVIDRLPTAVLVVDELMYLLQANPAAEAMLAGKGIVMLRNGRVVGRSKITAIEEAVAQAGRDETILSRRGGTGFAVHGANGEARVVHVMPLRKRESSHGLFRRATAALFITDGDRDIALPVDAFAGLYGLTPSEARIAELVVKGSTPQRIAEALGLRLSTVKTHLLNVFDKTGVRRQVDLIRLAASLAGPVTV